MPLLIAIGLNILAGILWLTNVAVLLRLDRGWPDARPAEYRVRYTRLWMTMPLLTITGYWAISAAYGLKPVPAWMLTGAQATAGTAVMVIIVTTAFLVGARRGEKARAAAEG